MLVGHVLLFGLFCVQCVVNSTSAHFVDSSGVPFPSAVRNYTLDSVDAKSFFMKGKCSCFCKVGHIGPTASTLCQGPACNEIPKEVPIVNRRLRLHNMNVTALARGDFANYSELVELELDSIRLTHIMDDAFANLNRLVNLSITYNSLERLSVRAFHGLDSLTRLRLTKNRFSALSAVLPALTAMSELSVLVLSENSLRKVDDKEFQLLRNSSLAHLDLSKCQLEDIHPDAFIHLRNLTRLSLSHNVGLSFDTLANLFSAMRNTGNLQVLDLSNLFLKINDSRKLFQVLAVSSVSELRMNKNTIPRLGNDTFPLMPNIVQLELSSCDISEIDDEVFVHHFPRLRRLSLAHNDLSTIPKAVTVLSQLEWLDLTDNRARTLGKFEAMESLVYLDLTDNYLIHQVYRNSFVGLSNLRELRMRNCSIIVMEEECFEPLTSLKVLDLGHNKLNPFNYSRSLFRGLKSLEHLRMDNSKIRFTDQEALFSEAPRLQHLNLTGNQIESFDEGNPFKGAPSLISVDLSENSIHGWTSPLFNDSPSLDLLNLATNKISTITPAMLEDFASLSEVNLLGLNPIICDDKLTFLRKYAVEHNDTSEDKLVIKVGNCGGPEELRGRPIPSFLLAYEDKASGAVMASYILVPVAVVILIVGIVTYKNRWLIRLHLIRKRLNANRVDGEPSAEYSYDAFVSYSKEDNRFVARMVTVLEDSPPHFKLCVYERDFTAGNVLNDCIVQSIATSRKVVLVVSEHFVQSHWCLWELHLAQHSLVEDKRNHSLVLVVIGKMKSSQLPPTLRYLMKTRIYLEWVPEEQDQQLFWERLREALVPCNSLSSRASSTTQIT